jgi:hypothetical protein
MFVESSPPTPSRAAFAVRPGSVATNHWPSFGREFAMRGLCSSKEAVPAITKSSTFDSGQPLHRLSLFELYNVEAVSCLPLDSHLISGCLQHRTAERLPSFTCVKNREGLKRRCRTETRRRGRSCLTVGGIRCLLRNCSSQYTGTLIDASIVNSALCKVGLRRTQARQDTYDDGNGLPQAVGDISSSRYGFGPAGEVHYSPREVHDAPEIPLRTPSRRSRIAASRGSASNSPREVPRVIKSYCPDILSGGSHRIVVPSV